MEAFTIGGRRISISPELVEDLLEDVVAGPLNKHFVIVRGRRFPVKQALALVAKIPPSEFISTEAVRVFKGLGFEIGRIGESRDVHKTESEGLFEQYLQAHGLGHYRFEPNVAGTSRRPDYLLSFKGSEIFLEVKQFEPTPDDFRVTGGAYDPYGPISEKLEAGRKKFKNLEDRVCCLVLFNRGRPLVDISWRFVCRAMLGNMGFRMPFDPVKGQIVEEGATQIFVGGGKMRKYENGKPVHPQNQTISAIIVRDRLELGRRRFLASMRQREATQQRKFDCEETMRMLDAARGTERDWGLLQLRTVVCENPDARNPLGRQLFNGPFDERYGDVNNHIARVFCGDEIRKLEEEEETAKQNRGTTNRDWKALPPLHPSG